MKTKKEKQELIDFFMSDSSETATIEEGAQMCLPAMPLGEMVRRTATLQRQRKERMANLINDVGHGDFWTQPRGVQLIRMLARKDVHRVFQTDIAMVLGVSNSLVTKKKQQQEDSPGEAPRRPGRRSELSDVFPLLENFIAGERRARRAVTMNVVMAFLADHIRSPEVTTKNASAYLQRHGYAYKLTVPTDATRVDVEENDIVVFYTRTLPEALNGVQSSLVFNMDEMGAEMFADRKRMFVFVPVENLTNGQLAVGVPRSTRRCTLVACICLDGSRLRHTVITKTMTISSAVFAEGGLTSDRVKFAHTQNSFINNEVFGEWLCDVFLPEVIRKRAWLRERLGTYDERAVLILDGLKCHVMEPFVELLRRHNVTMVVLVPHSSHMTQPLDVGILRL